MPDEIEALCREIRSGRLIIRQGALPEWMKLEDDSEGEAKPDGAAEGTAREVVRRVLLER